MALSCGDWCPLCLVKLFCLAKGVSQNDFISWWLCPLLPAPLIAVLNEQFVSCFHSYFVLEKFSKMREEKNLKALCVCVKL